MLSVLRESALWLQSLFEHRRALSLSRAELEALQKRKFRDLVAYAQAHSPYWRRVIAEHGIDPANCVPTDFPVLTKQQINEHFDEIVTDRRISRADVVRHTQQVRDINDLYLGQYRVIHTSGSSGTSLYQLFTREDWIRGASLITRITLPFRLRMRCAYVASTMPYTGGTSLMNSGSHGLNRLLFDMRMYDAATPLPETVRELNAFQPDSLGGYSMMIQMLAEAQLRGELNIRPRHVGVGGEGLSPTGRAIIEKAFGVPVHLTYASSEHLYMGLSVQPGPAVYLMEDELMFELQEDHTCVTNLFNYTLPLIRHRMEDILADAVDAPPSSLPFRRVTVSGRMENALFYENAEGERDFIHPLMLTDFIAPGLMGWQAVVTGPASLTLRVLLDSSLPESQAAKSIEIVRAEMAGILKQKRMTRVQLTMQRVEALFLDAKTGKFKLVVHENAAA
jgi:phenylacetate-coenzyme A ligase PaaK-like adenylate-forming protein